MEGGGCERSVGGACVRDEETDLRGAPLVTGNTSKAFPVGVISLVSLARLERGMDFKGYFKIGME